MLGEHKWKKDDEGSAKVECRYDWHQTATHVTVAIYGKKYDPDISKIEVHGVRLKVHVYFPEQAGAFDLDLELGGVSCKNSLYVTIVFPDQNNRSFHQIPFFSNLNFFRSLMSSRLLH